MDSVLQNLNSEELGILFPIILIAHNPAWPKIFLEEKKLITSIFDKERMIHLEHIGSTAIPGIMAKPTIDILMIIEKNLDVIFLSKKLCDIGYIALQKPENSPPHLMLVKGYSPKGFEGQAFHIHVRYCGQWNELCFRDYLRANSNAAFAYEKLKIQLAHSYPNNREAYTEGKTDFVKSIVEKARKEGYGKE